MPKTVVKKVAETLAVTGKAKKPAEIKKADIPDEIEKLKGLMKAASAQLDFERAIEIRERIAGLRKQLRQ